MAKWTYFNDQMSMSVGWYPTHNDDWQFSVLWFHPEPRWGRHVILGTRRWAFEYRPRGYASPLFSERMGYIKRKNLWRFYWRRDDW